MHRIAAIYYGKTQYGMAVLVGQKNRTCHMYGPKESREVSYYGQPHASLVSVGQDLAFISSYDAKLVEKFKAFVPPDARRWDAANKRWIVSPKYAKVCIELADTYLGVKIMAPPITATPATEIKLIKVDYVGRCKVRDDGSSAFGWAGGSWSVIFPEAVLRDYFAAEPMRPDEQPTLYAVLAVKQGAKADEIKANYRRLAKTWHPDVCHEIDATKTFRAIQHAYEVLSDATLRQKYDVGLQFAGQVRSSERIASTPDQYGYRSPFRCGYMLVEGRASLGRFSVGKILDWRDIVDSAGRVMSVSWPVGANMFDVVWT